KISSLFFQAEDGIRDRNVTGVQTCALPILIAFGAGLNDFTTMTGGFLAEKTVIHCDTSPQSFGHWYVPDFSILGDAASTATAMRSEERRVGREDTTRGQEYECPTVRGVAGE